MCCCRAAASYIMLSACFQCTGSAQLQYDIVLCDSVATSFRCPTTRLQIPTQANQLTKVLDNLRHTFVVADATLPDCPLVYASEG